MIDIESQIFTKLDIALEADFGEISVESVTNYEPQHFPTVSIEEADNSALRRTQDSGSTENHVVVMYEVNVFTAGETAKSQAKAIFEIIDKIMTGMNFSRMRRTPMPMPDRTLYRLVGRYQAVVSANETIYTR